MKTEMHSLTPPEVVDELNKDIIGQLGAKRAVAIAFRNRWRRLKLSDEKLKEEIFPKNILMIGPTGVGKTEIARRLAKLAGAPFIKVEATKFTEVGYVGRDVDSIIRDLIDAAVKQERERAMIIIQDKAIEKAHERVLKALLEKTEEGESDYAIRESMSHQLKTGVLDNEEIEIDVSLTIGVEIMAPPGMEEMTGQLQNLFQNMSSDRKKKRKLLVKEACKLIKEEEASKLIDDEEVKRQALFNVEQNGIVFIDEIDKVTRRSDHTVGADVSREGVQRDLLPLVEGCSVSTKYGMVNTNHILFIASGAFHLTKPSDLIPELQGRLPIRVELSSLSVEDFYKILTEPQTSLIKQYTALLNTEAVSLEFKEKGIKRIAEVAWEVNERTENIGARRLHTVMERLLENISYEAASYSGKTFLIDEKYVNKQLSALVKDEDWSRYIL